MANRTTGERLRADRAEPITRGTGNVFADLGFPDAADRQARLRLGYVVNHVLEARTLSQADAAKVLGLTQPALSSLQHQDHPRRAAIARPLIACPTCSGANVLTPIATTRLATHSHANRSPVIA